MPSGPSTPAVEQGFHAHAKGKNPRVRVILDNARPLDQSATISRLAPAFETIPAHSGVRLYQNRATTFFDPRIFPSIRKQDNVCFYAPEDRDPRGEAVRNGDSILEAFYVPEQSWEAANATSLFLKQNLNEAIGRRNINKPTSRISLFVSLEFEKRVWVEQIEALLSLFRSVTQSEKTLTVTVNGMTGSIFSAETRSMMSHFSRIHEKECETISYWKEELGRCVSFVH